MEQQVKEKDIKVREIMSQKDQAEREKRKQDEEFDKMQARIRDMEQQLIAQKTSAKNLGATQSATDQAQDKLV